MTKEEKLREATRQGYPRKDLEDIVAESYDRYLEAAEEHGPGKNWLQDGPRWHIWKACDELFQARDAAYAGREEQARARFADTLNHMLFAMEIARTDQPATMSHKGGDR